jgi:L-fuconolactonase
MRIDSHQHFWKYNRVRDAWITDDMKVIQRDFFPADLLPECTANQINATIAVQADQSESETLFLLELAEGNSFITGVVGWVDLCSANVAERLHYFSRYKKLCGFRHVAQAEPDDRFLVRGDFLRGIRGLREWDFTYDILVYPKQLPAAMELVAAVDDQKFVIDHLAKPEIKTSKKKEWESLMRQIAQNPNVYCKVSGMVTEADWRSWKKEDFWPYLDVVFDAFGTNRLMFGSDWPVCLVAASYGQVVGLVEEYLARHVPSAVEKIFGENAARFYRSKKDQHGLAA